MGWETLAIAGFSALNAVNTVKQGDAAAKAAVQQGQYQTQQIADNTTRTGGQLITSFAQSGIGLDSGGTQAVLAQAFAKGQVDIGRTAANANATAKNDINSARTKALESLASGASGSAFGSLINGPLTDAANSVGQSAGSLFDPSPTGPYLSPLTRQFYQ